MEATREANENETPTKTQNRGSSKRKSKEEDSNVSGGSRRTRSQVAPGWTVKDAMILVNEYAAVEAECLTALSTYQKWKIITENCTAFWDVPRSLNQCRRKWNTMLDEYKKIKQCDCHSFWTLESGKRRKLGLPEDFDCELFEAIDNIVSAREDQADTDPDIDIDPEAETDLNDVIAELGSKRQRQGLTPPRCDAEKNIQETTLEEKPPKIQRQEKSQKWKCHVEEKPGDSDMEEQPFKSLEEEKNTLSLEEKQQMMAVSLREKAEHVHAIVKGHLAINGDYGGANLKNVEDLETHFVRRQADRLIACFQDIVNTLHQLNGVVQEYE